MNVPPSKNPNNSSHSFLGRRRFLSHIGGLALGAASGSVVAQEVDATKENIQAQLENIMSKFPHLRKVNADYDARMRKKFQDSRELNESDNTPDSWEMSDGRLENRVIQKYGDVVSFLSNNLNLDSGLMIRLIMHESQGKSNSESFRGAQGLMQIMPETAQDLAKRFPMYQPYFQSISPALASLLKTPIAKDMVTKLMGEASLARKPGVMNSVLSNLYNPEINLIFGHIYFAGLRDQLAPKMDSYQLDLAKYFENLTPAHYQQISSARLAMGADPLSLDYFRNDYAKRLLRDRSFALDAESLLQYNGWGNRPKQSFRYAATIQV